MSGLDTLQLRAGVYLEERGITEQTAREYGLEPEVSPQGWPGVAIPYRSALGAEVSRRWRVFDAPRKYDQRSTDELHLFNVVDAVRSPVFVTEGEFDAILLKQLGRHAVGTPGTNGFKDEWRWLFAGCDVFIIFDHDPVKEIPAPKGRTKRIQPGPDAAKKLHRLLDRVAHRVVNLTEELPVGRDVTEAHLAGELEGVLP